MVDDGRGDLLPPVGIVARVWAWLAARPILVALAALLLGLGVQTARLRWRDSKADRLQKKADLLKLKNSREVANSREAAALGHKTELDRALAQSDVEAAAGRAVAETELEKRRRLAAKWPTRAVFLAVALSLAQTHELAQDGSTPGPSPTGATAAPSCAPDANLAGLLSAVAETQRNLLGLDAAAVSDLLAVVETYRAERAGLCAQLDAGARARAVLEGQVALRDGLLTGCQADRALAWQEWEAQVKKPRATGRPALGFAVGGGLCVDGDGDVTLCGAGVFGWRF